MTGHIVEDVENMTAIALASPIAYGELLEEYGAVFPAHLLAGLPLKRYAVDLVNPF